MAASKKKKKHTQLASIAIPAQPPVDVLRDTNHLSKNSNDGQALRTKKELDHDIDMRKIESEEKIALYKLKTARIRNYLLFTSGGAGVGYNADVLVSVVKSGVKILFGG